MSGHNKWAQIKHQKASTDAKRSKVFTKLVRMIAVESKKANGKVDAPGLRAAITKAREANMPNDNIERAVKKGVGETGQAMEPLTYEAYGPGGVAIIVEALTDNRNKAAQEVKFILSQHGSALAAPGAASWAFQKNPGGGWTPTMTTDLSDEDAAKLGELVDELENNDEVQEVFTNASLD